jgi:hypothetical protein
MRLIALLVAAAALTAASAALASGSGIRGRVTSSPTCPVQRYPPDPGCAPRGVKARVSVRRSSDRRVVARFTTRSDGRFSVRLRAGRYLVSVRPAAGALLPRCPGERAVRVRSGSYARIAIDCDSGIR